MLHAGVKKKEIPVISRFAVCRESQHSAGHKKTAVHRAGDIKQNGCPAFNIRQAVYREVNSLFKRFAQPGGLHLLPRLAEPEREYLRPADRRSVSEPFDDPFVRFTGGDHPIPFKRGKMPDKGKEGHILH